MAPMHRHDSRIDAPYLRFVPGSWMRRLATWLRGARSGEALPSFTMLLPDGQLAKSCCQRLAELIGYAPACDGESGACSI